MQYIITLAHLYFSNIQAKLPVQISLNLFIRKINYMSHTGDQLGPLLPPVTAETMLQERAQQRLLPAGSLPA